MKARDFCYWLQGFFELMDPKEPTEWSMDEAQVRKVRSHLALVFKHEIDPSIDGGDPAKKAELDAIHKPPPPPHDFGPGGMGGVMLRC